MRHVALFGSTGSTGICVVRAALEKGLKIRALVGDSSVIDSFPTDIRDKLDVVYGDVLNIIDVRTTMDGQEAAIMALGSENEAVSGSTAASEGLKNIMAVMQALRINILSVCLPLQLLGEPHRTLANQDHQRVLRFLDASDLHWVAVDSSHVVDQPASGYITKRSPNTRVTTISRHDLAKFLVDCLTMPENYQKIVRIASIPHKSKVMND